MAVPLPGYPEIFGRQIPPGMGTARALRHTRSAPKVCTSLGAVAPNLVSFLVFLMSAPDGATLSTWLRAVAAEGRRAPLGLGLPSALTPDHREAVRLPERLSLRSRLLVSRAACRPLTEAHSHSPAMRHG
ncbi:hypothetical protein GCM10009544_56780 [Streptomyces stramineus]|uniref:Uncharacterized protein n=1 Tax=Streptomyces stramineus TaxID=173861 RepID=A0ABN1B1A1_9ACTN